MWQTEENTPIYTTPVKNEIDEERIMEKDDPIYSQEAKRKIHESFQQIQNVIEDSDEHQDYIDFKISLLNQCEEALEDITNKMPTDLNAVMEEYIADKNYEAHEINNENKSLNEVDQPKENRKYEEKKLPKKRNSNGFQTKSHVKPKLTKPKKTYQVSKSNGQRYQQDAFKIKSKVFKASKPKKCPQIKTPKKNELDQGKQKISVQVSSLKKQHKKFVAATPNSIDFPNNSKRGISIQTDISVQITKRHKSKMIPFKPDQDKTSPKSTPTYHDTPFRSRSTQTAKMQEKLVANGKKKRDSNRTEETSDKQQPLNTQPRKQIKVKKNIIDRSTRKQVQKSQDETYEMVQSDDEHNDPTFKMNLLQLIPKRELDLPPRKRDEPECYGFQFPSAILLDRYTMEGSDEEIRNYQQRKIQKQKDENDRKRNRMVAQQMYLELHQTVGTQTENHTNTPDDNGPLHQDMQMTKQTQIFNPNQEDHEDFQKEGNN